MPEQITDLDKENRSLTTDKLTKFLEHYDDSVLNMKEKGPDYLIIDNFLELVSLTKEDIVKARSEGEFLAS